MEYKHTWIDPDLDPNKPIIITSWYVRSEFVTSDSASIIFKNLYDAEEALQNYDKNPKITYNRVKQYEQ
jgi:hypothetical protein